MTHPEEEKEERTEEWADRTFPNRGEFPGNDVVEDPDAEPSPNVQHPE